MGEHELASISEYTQTLCKCKNGEPKSAVMFTDLEKHLHKALAYILYGSQNIFWQAIAINHSPKIWTYPRRIIFVKFILPIP